MRRLAVATTALVAALASLAVVAAAPANAAAASCPTEAFRDFAMHAGGNANVW